MALIRILIDRKKVEQSRDAKTNLGCIMIYPFSQQVAPHYVKGVRGKGEWELLPLFGSDNKNGYDGHVMIVTDEENIEIIE